jgi:hypothetical protein
LGSLVVVGGSIASNFRNGGIAWERLSWALGLRRLGLDVLVVDQLDRERCVYRDGAEPSYETCLNRGYFERIVEAFGLAGSAALVGEGCESLSGPTYAELLDLAGEADLLVNVAGNLRLEELKQRPRLRVYVDVDPGLTQLRLASGGPHPRIGGHHLHFTIGENIGLPGCPLPTCGFEWRHTRQPVLLDEWPVVARGQKDRFTTVASWRGVGPYGPEANGIGQKADQLAKVIDLPGRAPGVYELALKIAAAHSDDRRMLERHGWRVVDATAVASDPDSFRQYVQRSSAEFSVAKGAYAETQSGWFSDRTTRYLASGKPALVQDTGFARNIPVGEGLIAFSSLDEAVEGARRIVHDYDGHARAARQLAEDFFDSDLVLTRFLADVEAAR